MTSPLGVGIVGLSATGNWAAGSHLPALRHVDGFELRGVSASSAASAAASSLEYDIPHAFANAEELATHDEIDLVVVAVKVPHHRELVMTALDAGKMVYCEWPLGNGLAESEELAAAAHDRGLRTTIGLQARASPTFRFLRDLIADGYVGEVLSTSIIASGFSWGADVPSESYAYNIDATNGVSLLTIPVGHTLDAASLLLGEFTELTSTLATRRPRIRNTMTGEFLTMTVADQVALTGRLESGAVAAVHFRGGLSRGTNLLWEINGTEGDLVITGPSGHVQLADLTIKGGRGENVGMSELAVPDSYNLVPAAGASARIANVANAYALLRDDLTKGTSMTPTFDHAVLRHTVLDAIARAGGRTVA